MKQLSEYTPEEQATIISNFMDDEYGNDEYDADTAIFHFKEEVDELVDYFDGMSGENNLEIYVSDYTNNSWEINGEIGFLYEDADKYVEAVIKPIEPYGATEVMYEFPTVLFDGSEGMSYGELADRQDEITNNFDWELMRMTDDINALAEEFGYKAAYGCDINDAESVRDFLQENKHKIDLDKYLY